MSFMAFGLVASTVLSMQATSNAGAYAEANAINKERQTYEEMKRSQLGAMQDQNRRRRNFAEYEESVLLASGGRQDRSVDAIKKRAKELNTQELKGISLKSLGQQSLLARQGDNARVEANAAIAEAKNSNMQSALGLGIQMHQLGFLG